MDIKTANVLLGSLKDEDEYYLTVEQLVGLKFGDKNMKNQIENIFK